MDKVLAKEAETPAHEKDEPEREDNRAWALKWDGVALAAARGKRKDPDGWDRR